MDDIQRINNELTNLNVMRGKRRGGRGGGGRRTVRWQVRGEEVAQETKKRWL